MGKCQYPYAHAVNGSSNQSDMPFKIHSEFKHNTMQLNEFKTVAWEIWVKATTFLEDKMVKLRNRFSIYPVLPLSLLLYWLLYSSSTRNSKAMAQNFKRYHQNITV